MLINSKSDLCLEVVELEHDFFLSLQSLRCGKFIGYTVLLKVWALEKFSEETRSNGKNFNILNSNNISMSNYVMEKPILLVTWNADITSY